MPFKNVIYDYPLGRAMADGFVKEPAVVTRKNFNPAGMSPEEIERLKLEDGIRLHESVKVELETYARETDNPIVKPFLLVIARDTTHAGQLLQLIQSDGFFEGRYTGKGHPGGLQQDRQGRGGDDRAAAQGGSRPTEPTEIVIHVNMLKEGWDVTNLYTIVPLRAANARILIEQSIGRGLRLPYGKRTGVMAVDRLNIVAHDKFQEIIDEANRPDSAIRLQAVVLDDSETWTRRRSRWCRNRNWRPTGAQAGAGDRQHRGGRTGGAAGLHQTGGAEVAQIAWDVIRKYGEPAADAADRESSAKTGDSGRHCQGRGEQHQPVQLELEGFTEKPDIAAVVAKTVELVTQQTIDIPRILVVPKGEVKSGFKPFTLSSTPEVPGRFRGAMDSAPAHRPTGWP